MVDYTDTVKKLFIGDLNEIRNNRFFGLSDRYKIALKYAVRLIIEDIGEGDKSIGGEDELKARWER